MKIAIVTDSTADIPPEIVEQHRIEVVPTIIVMEGKSMEDGTGISRREFYEKMPALETLAAGVFRGRLPGLGRSCTSNFLWKS